jgi:hypothetical protein
MSDLATWAGSGGTIIAIVAAVAVAVFQIRSQRQQTAIERTIAAHRDLTAGEIGAARDRLSEFMWSTGSKTDSNRCYKPSWEELLGSEYVVLGSGDQDLSAYPASMGAEPGQTPLRDLYRILWSLERVGVAYHAQILDSKLALEMLANHVVWWNILCERIPLGKTRYRRSLSELSDQLATADPGLIDWARADFDTEAPELGSTDECRVGGVPEIEDAL